MAFKRLSLIKRLQSFFRKWSLNLELVPTGSEEGSYLSVEGQVNSLIMQARDPKRLCQLFVGWQPYIWNRVCDLTDVISDV